MKKKVYLRPYVTLYVEDGAIVGGSFDGGWAEGIYAEDENDQDVTLTDDELRSIANRITELRIDTRWQDRTDAKVDW